MQISTVLRAVIIIIALQLLTTACNLFNSFPTPHNDIAQQIGTTADTAFIVDGAPWDGKSDHNITTMSVTNL